MTMRMRAARRAVWAMMCVALWLGAAGAAQAVVIKGKGELRAAGSGVAVLVLRGGVEARGVGLAVVEEAAIVELDGHGRVTPIDDGRVLLEGFGRIVVRSLDDRTRVEVAGAHLRLHARGAGVAILKGHGHFSTREHDGAWADAPEIELEPEP